jgi:phosphoenolpyruvate phosphomutase
VDRAAAKRGALRERLASGTPVAAVGAHDAMTARLAERFDFDAVWVSGLGVSTMAYAVPDLNLLSMSEMLAAAQRIDGATDLPVIVDCDNGYGGTVNLVRTVREFERAGIAAICVEDNVFPKRNSLYLGEARRDLLAIEEQSRRIRAAKGIQQTEDFTFIARIESLIAGYGPDDACNRADAYVDAGADAILVHSRDPSLGDLEAFLERWPGVASIPLVAVPTLFGKFTVEQLHQRGFRLVIFANQPMRAAVAAMERALETLRRERRAGALDDSIAPLEHIFELVNTREAIELDESG